MKQFTLNGIMRICCVVLIASGISFQANAISAEDDSAIEIAPQQVQNLNLTSECTFDLDERRWRVTNPNSFEVEVTWQVFGTSQSGSLTATPGLTHFTTMNTGGANTTKIFWQDENGNTKEKTKAANNNLCEVDPVEDLNLTSLCSDSDDVREWRVTNPNDFNVDITWEVVGSNQNGGFTATPGLTFFTTINVGGANTTKIFWQDETNTQQQKTKASGNQICEPDTGDGDCNDYRLYYADVRDGESGTMIYSISLEDGDAILNELTPRDYELHLSYNSDANKLYAVNSDGSEVEIIDAATGISEGFISLANDDFNFSKVIANTYRDNKIYLGDQDLDIIVALDLADNSISLIADDVPVQGGDLIWRNDELFLATRAGNRMLKISGGMATEEFGIPSGVNGITVTNNGQILMANFNSTAFNKFNADGTSAGAYNAILDGESYTLENGDLAGGCNNSQDDSGDGDCENYVLYYADSRDNDVEESEIFGISLTGNQAILTSLVELDYATHISYNSDLNRIYASNSVDSTLEVLDAATGDMITSFPLDGVGKVVCNTFYNGMVYLGVENQNRIIQVNPTDGTFSDFATNIPVSGGDLVWRNDELLLATRNGNRMLLISGGAATEEFGIPNKVNGIALTDTNNILMANFGSTAFNLLDGSGTILDTYDVVLDGDSYTLENGDLSGGCNNSQDDSGDGDCENYVLYYANHPAGVDESMLFGVSISGGMADLDLITELDYETHISYNTDENVIYATKREGGNSSLEILLPSTGENLGSIVLDGIGNGMVANVYHEGMVYIGIAPQDRIIEVDPTDGSYDDFATDVPVAGGDLIWLNGKLYLASRYNDDMYLITEGGGATQVFDIAIDVNGIAVTNDGNILMSNFESTAFNIYDASGALVDTLDAMFDGVPFTLLNGDLAGGCNNSSNDDDDDGDDTCIATQVIAFEQGQTSNGSNVPDNRSDVTAIEELDKSNAAGGFVSLGIGGTLTLQFPGAVFNNDGDDIKVYETSFSGDNCSGANDERALIELSQDGVNWVSAGEICRDGSVDIDGLGLAFVTQIRITDITAGNGDGFDVDGVEVINGGCGDVPNEDEDVCYGSVVVENSYLPGPLKNGNPMTNPQRINPDKALGAPQNDDTMNFVSLGYGGEIIIGFDGAVMNEPGNDIEVVETTFNNQTFESYPESGDVYVRVTENSPWYRIGEVRTNEFAQFDIDDAEGATEFLPFITQVKIVDTTPETSQSTDAFDLDGIVALTGCTEMDDDFMDEYGDLLSTDDNDLAANFVLYPVPASNQLNVKMTVNDNSSVSYEIVSILGQTYNRGTVEARFGSVEINENISSLAEGTYFMIVNVNGQTITKQFVKSAR